MQSMQILLIVFTAGLALTASVSCFICIIFVERVYINLLHKFIKVVIPPWPMYNKHPQPFISQEDTNEKKE